MEFRNVCHTNVFSFVNKSMGPLREAGGREEEEEDEEEEKEEQEEDHLLSYYRSFWNKNISLMV